ncbi:HAD-IA family hydrolase [Geodermatophilus ruber]|uniref:Sugar-phosphatase n=1 Tax=Geodermatophilus ruber TaxID=504800 RepID=A0A1I4FD03_9ACTN|nr:HAD-IA family hydrolase [Geodermatophilus ruber]SFL15343.1 sugar-phosphatase [Geodermatophilus ruber]
MTVAVPCRGLLFDSDGVLVDSDAVVELSWSRWAEERDLDAAAVLAMVHGRRSADTVALLVEEAARTDALAAIDRYEVEDAAGVTALPGAADLLTALPAGAWAVVTSGRQELVTARLAEAGLPVPPVLVCAEDVPAGKPDPAGYARAAARLGLPAGECVVLEDSPAGVAAGMAAGATVVGVGERALGTPAEVVVRDLRGLRFDGARLAVPPEALLRSSR